MLSLVQKELTMKDALNIQEDGIEIKKDLLSSRHIQKVIDEMQNSGNEIPRHGIRNAEKKFSSILEVVGDSKIFEEAKNILGGNTNVVRVIFFDKTPEKNWLVTWHQDKTVALNKKINLEGWGPWTLKDGTHHVQPPLGVLNKMVTFRLHLDAANDENGCLKVIPESHKAGILKQSEIENVVANHEAISCVVEAGDAVIMRPHLLHSSSKALEPKHRRVIHIEFSSYKLPEGVCWA